jgi:replicative DNA helicase
VSEYGATEETGLTAWTHALAETRVARRQVARTLVHDERLERTLLGELIFDLRAVGAVAQILRGADDFAEPRHRVIYEAILRVVRTGRAGLRNAHGATLDFLELVEAVRHVPLQRFPGDTETVSRLNTVGGAQYLGELTDGIVTAAQVEVHAQMLRALADRRRELDANARAFARLCDPDLSPEAALGAARGEYLQSMRAVAATRGHSQRKAIDGALRRIELAAENKSLTSTTGFPSIDGTDGQEAILGGFGRGQYITLAAVTGSGKTTWALQAAAHIAARHGRVLFFAQEADREELVTKMACGRAGVDPNLAREARLSQDDFQKLTEAFQSIAALDFVWYDSGTTTSADVRMFTQLEAMRAEAEGTRVALVVVDYLQILARTPAQMALSRVEQIEEMSLDLRESGKSTGIPHLVLSQFNRVGAKGKEKDKAPKPTIFDLKGSGAIENDSHVVILLYGEGDADPVTHRYATILCDVQKNRLTGVTRAFPMRYEKRFDRFVDVQAEQFVDGVGAALHAGGGGAAPEDAEADPRFRDDDTHFDEGGIL